MHRCTKTRQKRFWFGVVAIFLLALSVRLSRPASKYTVWYERSAQFWDALLNRDWAGTYQRHHPGVTTMWIAGSGMRLYLAAQGQPASKMRDLPSDLPSPQGPAVRAGVAVIGLVVALCVVGAYVLLSRMSGWKMAFVAGWLMALDPFHITHSKMIHVDALLSGFMLLSVLFLITHLTQKTRGTLVVSGVFGGLSFLSKSPALFLFPYTGLITTIQVLTEDGLPGLAAWGAWAACIWKVLRSLLIWGIVVAFVVCTLWPAMLVQPVKTVSNVLGHGALRHAEKVHPFPQFFLGRNVKDPGLLYYPINLAWKTTLVTLPAIGLAIWFLMRRKQRAHARSQWYSLIYVGAFLIQMSLGAKKISRYVLPAFLALDVVAAWGLVQTADALSKWRRWRNPDIVPAVTIGAALLIHLGAVIRVFPYFGTHHNLLLGGSAVAQHVFQLGDQGEGLDLAAQYLNDQPGAGFVTVGVCDHGNLMFRENFVGVTKPINHHGVDYRVFFTNDLQRSVRFAHCEDYWEACKPQGPDWSASFDGVPYVWICRAYPQDLDSFPVDRRMNVQVGEHLELLGYRLRPDEIRPGDLMTVTLYWRSDGEAAADNHVFVHLLDEEERLVAQHDGVPGQAERPTWSWQQAEVVPDMHVLGLPDGVPAGVYTLSVGMYDYGTQARLPATTEDGTRLPVGRISLRGIEVRSP
ncbi:MAG: phospholipid carrier-dependent glycosyltransferase [Chloroflexota bacterium]|nr:phospholipid carrier-dependent glycosyltransferase [Chloroflexota bacterium]